MGVITLALIAYGSWTDLHAIPTWVKVACALTIAAGTYVGGWRVIRTMGKGLVEITSPQGMAAETTSAAIILTSSHLGMALSTTQVATGSILGSGVGARGATVRWGLAGRMAVAWVVTLPAAGVMGALCWFVAHGIGGGLGVAVVLGALILTAGGALLPVPPHADHAGQRQRRLGGPPRPIRDAGAPHHRSPPEGDSPWTS